MKELERSLKAVANRRRLAILKFIKVNHEASVGEIAQEIKLSFRSTSKHLYVLGSSDVVEKEQRSSQVFYKLSSLQKPVIRYIISLL